MCRKQIYIQCCYTPSEFYAFQKHINMLRHRLAARSDSLACVFSETRSVSAASPAPIGFSADTRKKSDDFSRRFVTQ